MVPTPTAFIHALLVFGPMKATLLFCLLVVTGSAVFNGCAGLVGRENLAAMDLARDCQRSEALDQLELAIDSGNPRHAARALIIKAALLLDEGRADEAKALYPEIRVRRDVDMPDSEIDAQVREVLREIRNAREKKTGSRQC